MIWPDQVLAASEGLAKLAKENGVDGQPLMIFCIVLGGLSVVFTFRCMSWTESRLAKGNQPAAKSKKKKSNEDKEDEAHCTTNDEPIPLTKRKKGKATEEELEAKAAEKAKRKEVSKAALAANKVKEAAGPKKSNGKDAKAKQSAAEALQSGPKPLLTEDEAKALFDKAQKKRGQAAVAEVQMTKGGRFAAFGGDDSD